MEDITTSTRIDSNDEEGDDADTEDEEASDGNAK